MDELMEQAAQIALLIRSPNVDDAAAVAAVKQLAKTAYSGGLLEATAHASRMMMSVFDAAPGSRAVD